MLINTNPQHVFLKQLTPEDFLHIGLNQIAYVKSVVSEDKKKLYSVHAADGTQISVMNSYMTAIASVLYNDMHPVTLH